MIGQEQRSLSRRELVPFVIEDHEQFSYDPHFILKTYPVLPEVRDQEIYRINL